MSKRLPRGITQTPAGWRISVQVRGRLYQRRFKPSTAQATVEAELLKARQRRGAGRAETAPGTFADDVTRYLADYLSGSPAHDERQRHLKLWTDALGADTIRTDLTRDDVARVLTGWRAQGLAADTCNKRRTALLALYHALDGRGGTNPVREIPKFRAPDPLPRGLAYASIEKALAKMPTCKTKVRLQVLAYTGMRPGQLMKLEPAHWDHRRHVLTVPGTTKGRGTKPYAIPVSQPATEALKAFDTLNAWGRFTWAPMNRMWKAAWRAAKLPEPAPVVYDLRHSFGSQIYRMTGNLKAAKDLLGHSSMRMTERYTLAAVPQHKIDAVRTAFGTGKRLASFAPATGVLRRVSRACK